MDNRHRIRIHYSSSNGDRNVIGFHVSRNKVRPVNGFRPNAFGESKRDLIFFSSPPKYFFEVELSWLLIADGGSSVLVIGDPKDLYFYSSLPMYTGIKLTGGNIYVKIINPDNAADIVRVGSGSIDRII